jgi:hypothetical protein
MLALRAGQIWQCRGQRYTFCVTGPDQGYYEWVDDNGLILHDDATERCHRWDEPTRCWQLWINALGRGLHAPPLDLVQMLYAPA